MSEEIKKENMGDEKELDLELTESDLEGIAGGVGVTQAAQRPSGMPCPQCKGFIPVTMQQIITEHSILCPHCGLRLNINHQESQQAIEALKKFQQAQKELEKRIVP